MRKFNINVNGKAYAVEVEEVGGGANTTPVVSSVAPVAAAPVAAPVATGNGTPVTAQMPGLVKEFCFKNGDTVKENDKIMIVEAMKMDTPVNATKGGVITYTTQVGANVDSGAVLCTIA